MPDVGFKSSLLREKLLPTVGCQVGGGVYGEIVSLLLLPVPCGPSLIHLSVDVSQPVSRFFSEVLVPYVAIDAVCWWEEMGLGSLHIATLKTFFLSGGKPFIIEGYFGRENNRLCIFYTFKL